MIQKKEFEEELTQILNKRMAIRKEADKIKRVISEESGLSEGEVVEILNNINKAEVKELFWIVKGIKKCYGGIGLEKHFTEHEVNMYQNIKAVEEPVEKYPVLLENVLQVTSEQWVLVTDVNFLYDLYQKQLINYNKNTQRPTVKVKKDGVTSYKIYVNKYSVNEICSLAEQGLFTPNGISLNISLDNEENDFEYNNGELILYSGQFDIIDGFHRYQGFMKAKMNNKDFNYPVIVNVFHYDETKACSYIAQEDKRNKIKQNYVRSMDATNPVSTLVQRLNEDTRCYLQGKIGKTEESEVSYVDLFTIIDKCFKIKREELPQYLKFFRNIFNTLIEDGVFDYSFISLVTTVKGAAMYDGNIQQIEELVNTMKNDFHGKETINKKLLTTIEEVGGKFNV